jgi:putative transposase
MVRYRRNLAAGGTFFFTIALEDRKSSALIDHIDALRTAMRSTRSSHPFAIDAIVVLAEHLHILMTLPEGDSDFPKPHQTPLHWRRHQGGNSGRTPSRRRDRAMAAQILGTHDTQRQRF